MPAKLTIEQVKTLRVKGKSSLFFLAFGILGFNDLTKEIHRPVCQKIQNYKVNRRIKVTLPRDWFKSSICSVAYPLWRAINDPNVRILIVQNSYGNASKKLQSIKQIVEKNEIFRALFPEILPNNKCRWTKDCLEFNRTEAHPEGTIEAAGTGTATVARHYDCIIEDDTVVPDVDAMGGLMQQPTAMDIEKAIGWHKLAHPLLLHPSESQIIVVGTRWAERDLLAWLDEFAPNYLSITRAVRENDKGESATPENGGKAVWSRFNDAVLDELASDASIGPYMFASLYMNNPTDAVNQIFKREWFNDHYYVDAPKNLAICMSVDPSTSEMDQAADPDYCVIMTTGVDVKSGDIYVLDYVRERLNPGQLVEAIFNQYRVFKPLLVKIESIAYQRTLNWYIKKMMEQLNIYFTIDEIKNLRGSKIDRIKGLQPYFSAGKIYIKSTMSELERELLSFPKAAHDDIADALCMQIDFWYHESEAYRKAYIADKGLSPFTGEAIINSLLGRAEELKSFPYDLGHMGERVRGNQLRSYAYAS